MHDSTFENDITNFNAVNIESSNNPSSFVINSDNINTPHSQVDNMVMIEAKRLVINERINTIRCKREEKFLEMELRKFQNKLYVSRPKFNRLPSQVEQFENIDLNEAVIGNNYNNPNNNENANESTIHHQHYQPIQEDDDHLVHTNRSISVIIKDKPIVSSSEKNFNILRLIFNSWHNYILEIQRLHQLKTKIQQNVMTRKLQRFFNTWKQKITHSKQLTAKNKEELELKNVKKIEMFVNMIKDKQKMPGKNRTNDNNKQMKCDGFINDSITMKTMKNNKNIRNNFINVEESHSQRLKVQKKIITEQRIKLAEQNRLIEEMKLQQIEAESRISKIKTINIAKTVMNICVSRSRRDYFMKKIIQQNEDEKLCNSSSRTCPGHLEARAVARKEKIRQRQIERERQVYEEKLKEETEKIKEKTIRKEHQRSLEQKAKMIRDAKEWEKAKNAEKTKIMNELADNFFRKYLLRYYIIKPLIFLVQISRNKMIMASKYFNTHRLRKTFNVWRNEVINQLENKYKLSIFIYNKNLLCYHFQQWLEFHKNVIRKYQVACDIYDLRIEEKYFNIWKEVMVKVKMKNNVNSQIASNFYDRMIKKNYFTQWKKYMMISDKINESDKRREQWRKLVQLLIPDYSPKYRGVLIDD